jgi:hypothetical protein
MNFCSGRKLSQNVKYLKSLVKHNGSLQRCTYKLESTLPPPPREGEISADVFWGKEILKEGREQNKNVKEKEERREIKGKFTYKGELNYKEARMVCEK